MFVLAVLLVLVVVLVEFEEGLVLLLFPPLNAEIAIFANPWKSAIISPPHLFYIRQSLQVF